MPTSYPDKIGARDLARSMTFRQWNERACRLANALLGLGLERGDAVAILAYNAVEWLEIYAATAKAGLVMVPINFRLVGSEIAYIVENSEAKACIVQADLVDRIDGIRGDLADRGGALHPLRRHRRAEAIQGLRGPDRLGLVGRAGGRCEARGHVGADVHVGHHGQAQGRHAQPRQPCGAQPRHAGRPRASTAPTRRCWSCRCATPTRCSSPPPSPMRARRAASTTAGASIPSTAALAGRDAGDVHLAGADALHHDAGAARGGEGRPATSTA